MVPVVLYSRFYCVRISRSLLIFHLLVTFFFLHAVSAFAQTPDSREWSRLLDAETQLELDEARSRRSGLSSLNRLSRSRCEITRHRAVAMLARAASEDAESDDRRVRARIDNLLKPYSEFSLISSARSANPGEDFRNPVIHPFLEFAAQEALNPDNVREGMRRFDFAMNNAGELDRAFVAFRFALLLRELHQAGASAARAEEALRTGEAFAMRRRASLHQSRSESERTGRPANDFDLDDWENLRRKIRRLIEDLEFDLLAEEYGEAYALYVQSRILFYEKNDYAAALEVARRLLFDHAATIYAQAARLLVAKCLERQNDIRAARAELDTLIKQHADGPYYGEANIELGRLILENEFDADSAEKHYREALRWFRETLALRDAAELFALPDRVINVATPRAEPTTLDRWGFTVYRRPDPREMTIGAQWYLNHHIKECLFWIGLIEFADGNFEQALAHFTEAGNMDANIMMLEEAGRPNALHRLRGACKQGFMGIRPEAERSMRRNERLRAAIGDMYYILEKFDDAIAVYQAMHDDPRSSPAARAYTLYGMGSSARLTGRDGDRERAAALYRQIIDKHPRSPFAPKAMIGKAYIYSGDPAQREKGHELFLLCHRRYPDTREGAKALTAMISHYYHTENYREAQRYAKMYGRRYRPDSPYYDVYEVYINRMKGRE